MNKLDKTMIRNYMNYLNRILKEDLTTNHLDMIKISNDKFGDWIREQKEKRYEENV